MSCTALATFGTDCPSTTHGSAERRAGDRGVEIIVELLEKSAPGPKEEDMLWTVCVVLIVLWALGLVSAYTMGGYVHALLIVALMVMLGRVIQGRLAT